eukprot:TRINITY_DN1356_c0_g1_i11.p2 TRINITY_DN1356_c0_g1~~TRINITY_DN1356_c0_g1_i11.p2  ORF type:complete len:177 (-),score=38.23 TRINITY_DN1356_c0_g1_i11:53-583(-)
MLAACSRTPALRSLRIPCARSRSTRAGTASKSPKTFVVVEMLKNEPGALGQAIGTFEKHGVNMTHIESRLKSFARDGPSFHIDFEGNHDDPNISAMLQELRQQCASVTVEEPQACPWFPVNIRDLDETRDLSLIHISEPTRLLSISYAVFCLKKKKKKNYKNITYRHHNKSKYTTI